MRQAKESFKRFSAQIYMQIAARSRWKLRTNQHPQRLRNSCFTLGRLVLDHRRSLCQKRIHSIFYIFVQQTFRSVPLLGYNKSMFRSNVDRFELGEMHVVVGKRRRPTFRLQLFPKWVDFRSKLVLDGQHLSLSLPDGVLRSHSWVPPEIKDGAHLFFEHSQFSVYYNHSKYSCYKCNGRMFERDH